MNTASPNPSNAFLAIFWGGMACGVLDITQACIAWGIQSHLPPLRILQSVASGLLGPKSFQGGVKTAALGAALRHPSLAPENRSGIDPNGADVAHSPGRIADCAGGEQVGAEVK